MTRRASGAWAAVLALAAQAVAASPDIDAGSGYRINNYRSPVTLPVQGGRRVDLAEVDRLVAEGAALVDVMPQRGGYDPATGAWRMVDRRETIPGAVWLPEVGRGAPDARLVAYFLVQLARATHEDRTRALIFFCMADCWMSWNAVKRASALGYTRVYWFADGTDGWREADRPTVAADPPPVPALEGQ